MIERQHLSILRAIHTSGSLTAAADQLCLSQSAVSHSIKKLEQKIGTPLWQVESRQLRFTPAGTHLLGLAQRLLPQLEHSEAVLQQIAQGERGELRIGMECHPCYQWLLRVVSPYLAAWPSVDVDVKQKFKFGGIGALFNHEIDMLVTPDPLFKKGLDFTPVFDYEQVLVVANQHSLASAEFLSPADLSAETLITYPVEASRLDIYTQFLSPAGVSPAKHQSIETTDIMLQMVAAGRGVASLPRWLVEEYQQQLDLKPLRLGATGLMKSIYLGVRSGDVGLAYIEGFLKLAKAL
ncbi:LysR family transcriptional regulator [Teredinibacter waterburyi]|jgi:transcriptional regulator, LysR family|uniref:LysR family transcriptional regulator n=1 Tax=Teredinibacter waterburyi TaxID=1500538 RepID=UPI00165EEC10|nr:LysR family transcriptional regulator [Teredinibacter waterburyi]